MQSQLVKMHLDDDNREITAFAEEQLKKIKETISKEYEIGIEKLNSLCGLQKKITELKIKVESQQQLQIQVPPKK
jgi:hypothetical protein